MSKGWNKKCLKVDLTRKKVTTETLDKSILHDFLGGRGINVRALYKLTDSNTDPLGPNNPLIFGTGPITGTMVPSNARYNVTARSPLTGILGDSNAGGFWAPELKYAGYDQIIITGKANKPVYLKIFDDEVEIVDAEEIWGKDVWETDNILRRKIGDKRIQIASIGQAGENMVRFAAIINNRARAAARTGMGAVMGSKLLKAVVVRGTKGVGIADRERFDYHIEKMMKHIYSAPSFESRSTYGTTMLTNLYNEMGTLPVRNSQLSYYQDADKISGETLLEKHVTRLKACFACPVHCSRYYEIKEGSYAGTRGEGPEFETICAFGSRCDNSNLESILYANNLCNKYGLDTMSTGNIIAFAMECYENRLITRKDTEGLELSWGNHEVLIDLITKIAYREGFGNVLAEGIKRASEAIPGSKRYALHVKGLELPAQDIRGMKEWGLGFAVASRGADHLRAFPLAPRNMTEKEAIKLFGTKDVIDRLKYGGKAKLVKWSEEISAVTDCLEICKFPGMGLGLTIEDMARIVTAVTGEEFSGEKLLQVGERVVNLERLYNNKMGMDRKDDRLPDRFHEEPVPDGNSKGEVFNENEMLDEYYQIRGWDEKGFPTEAKLSELGIAKL